MITKNYKTLGELIKALEKVPAKRWHYTYISRWQDPYGGEGYSTRIRNTKVTVEKMLVYYVPDSDENYGEEREYKYRLRINGKQVRKKGECPKLEALFKDINYKKNERRFRREKEAEDIRYGIIKAFNLRTY